MLVLRILVAGFGFVGMTTGYAMALGWLDQNLLVGLPLAVGSLAGFCWSIWVPEFTPMKRCLLGFGGLAWETMLLVLLVPRLAPSTWIKEHLEVWVAIGAGTTGILALAFLVAAGLARAVQPQAKP